jgi:hypothetical protein
VQHWFVRAAAVVGLAAVSGCATTHLLQPVGKNNLRLNASLGGPILRSPGPTPVPLVSVNAAYGVEDDVDIHLGLHPVAAAFRPSAESSPLLGMNAGAAWHPIARARHALTLGGEVYGFANRSDAVVYANAWIGGAGRPTPWLLLGGGVHNLLRVGSSEPEIEQRPFWTPTLFGLAEFSPSKRFSIDLEVRWYAFSQNGTLATVNWLSTGPIGVLGAMLGFNVNFGEGVR